MNNKQNFKVKKDGTKIVDADHSLEEKIDGNVSDIITEENEELAKEAIKKEGSHFLEDMHSDMQNLRKTFAEFNEETLPTDHKKENSKYFEEIKTTILSLKSSSGMHGYGLASSVARLLFNYCESMPCINPRGKKTIGVHINALNIIYRDDIKGDGGEIGQNLTKELGDMITQEKSESK